MLPLRELVSDQKLTLSNTLYALSKFVQNFYSIASIQCATTEKIHSDSGELNPINLASCYPPRSHFCNTLCRLAPVLKTIFIYVSYHLLVASLTLMALF